MASTPQERGAVVAKMPRREGLSVLLEVGSKIRRFTVRDATCKVSGDGVLVLLRGELMVAAFAAGRWLSVTPAEASAEAPNDTEVTDG